MIRAVALALCAIAAPAVAVATDGPVAAQTILPNVESWGMQAANGRNFRIFAALPKTPPPPVRLTTIGKSKCVNLVLPIHLA